MNEWISISSFPPVFNAINIGKQHFSLLALMVTIDQSEKLWLDTRHKIAITWSWRWQSPPLICWVRYVGSVCEGCISWRSCISPFDIFFTLLKCFNAHPNIHICSKSSDFGCEMHHFSMQRMPTWTGRNVFLNVIHISDGYREFPEKVAWGKEGVCGWNGEREWCSRGLSGVQQGSSAGVLVFKEASSRTEIQKPVNLQHNNSGV